MLEPVRQHAQHLLSDDEVIDCHRRHLDHYLAVARRSSKSVDELGSGTDLDALKVELGNFRAPWTGRQPTSRVSMRDCSSSPASTICGTSEPTTKRDCPAPSDYSMSPAGLHQLDPEAAVCAVWLASEMGDNAYAHLLFQQALVEAQAGGDRCGEVRARKMLAEEAVSYGDIATARQHLDTAIPIAVHESNDLLHARCLVALTNLLWATGRLDEAEQQIRAVLEGPVGTLTRVDTFAHCWFGRVSFEHGDYARARTCNQRILQLADSELNLYHVIVACLGLAEIECTSGNPDAAAAQIASADKLCPDTATGWDPDIAVARADMALVRGDNANALAYAEQAYNIDLGTDEPLFRCGILRRLGDAQLALDLHGDTAATFDQLIAMADPFPCRRAEGHEGAAATAVALEQLDAARNHLATANEIRHHTGSQRVQRPAIEHYLARLDPDDARPQPVPTAANSTSQPARRPTADDFAITSQQQLVALVRRPTALKLAAVGRIERSRKPHMKSVSDPARRDDTRVSRYHARVDG